MKTIRDAGAWVRVTSAFGTPRRPRVGHDGHFLWSGSEHQRVDVLCPAKTRLALVCPKPQPIRWWLEQEIVPPDVAVIFSPSPAEPRGLPLLEAVAGRAPAAFLNDLDPEGLVQFIETERIAEGRVRLRYAGIDDAWLECIEAALARRPRPGGGRLSLDRVCIALNRQERALLAKLERAVELEGLVGPRSAALLRGGRKLELEGATNPAIYGRRHSARVLKLIRAAVRPRAT